VAVATIHNRGPGGSHDLVMPTLWFRKTCIWPMSHFAKIELRGQLTQFKVSILKSGNLQRHFDAWSRAKVFAIMKANRERLYWNQKIERKFLKDGDQWLCSFSRGWFAISIQQDFGTKQQRFTKSPIPAGEVANNTQTPASIWRNSTWRSAMNVYN